MRPGRLPCLLSVRDGVPACPYPKYSVFRKKVKENFSRPVPGRPEGPGPVKLPG